MNEISNKSSTRQRILYAAGELFASKGFTNTTIRDICEKAEANVAAVNYHFGDKENLYLELIQSMEQEFRKDFIETISDDPGLSVKERLFQFLQSWLFKRLDPDRPDWKSVLFHNEMMKPSSRTVDLMAEMLERERNTIKGILSDFFEGQLSTEKMLLCIQSIIGQVFIFFHIYGPMKKIIEQHHGVKVFKLAFFLLKGHSQQLSRKDIDLIANHITEFSMGALAAIKDQSGDK